MALITAFSHFGFEFGTLTGVGLTVTGSPAIETSIVRTGTNALRVDPSAAAEYVQSSGWAAGTRVVAAGFYFRVDDYPAATARITNITRSGGNDCRLHLSSTGEFILDNAGTSTATGVTCPLDTWVPIILEFDTSANPVVGRVYFPTLSTTTFSRDAAVAAADITNMRLGSDSAHTMTFRYDDWWLSTTDGDFERARDGMRAWEVRDTIPSSDGTHNLEASGNFDSFTGTAFSNSTTNGWSFIAHKPLQRANTADQVIRAELGTAAQYMEVLFADITPSTGHTAIDVRSYGTHVESAASGTAFGEIRLMTSGGTVIQDAGGLDLINSTEDPGITVTTRVKQMVEPSGGWSNSVVDGLKARIGFTDNTPDANFIDLMLEVLYTEDAVFGTPITVTPTLPTGELQAGGGAATLDGVVLTVTPSLPTGNIGGSQLLGTVLTVTPSLPTGALRPSLHGVALTVTPSLPVGNIGGSQLLGTVLTVTPSLPVGSLSAGAAQLLGTVLTVTPTLPTGALRPSLHGVALTVTPTLPTGAVRPSSLVGTVLTITPTLPTGAVRVTSLAGAAISVTPTLPIGALSSAASLTGVALTVIPVLPKGEGVWDAANFISFAGANDTIDFDPDRINIAFAGDFWTTSDTGGGIFRTLVGDTVETDVLAIGNSFNTRLFMLRKSTAANAAFYCILTDENSSHITTVWRTADGGSAAYAGNNTGMVYNSAKPLRLRLVYSGGTVTGYASQDAGLTWTALPSPQSIAGLTLEGLVGGSGGTSTGTNVFSRGGGLLQTSVVGQVLTVTPSLPVGLLLEAPLLRGITLLVVPTLPLGSISGPANPQDLYYHGGQGWAHHNAVP